MQLKQIATPSLQVKDLDEAKGIVSFYFAAFGNTDADGDVIHKGAYTKTLDENQQRIKAGKPSRIKHFKNHRPDQVPGVIIEIGQDDVGGYAVSKMSQTTLGRDTLIEYKEGIITEHSHGFQVIKENFDKEKGVNNITEIKLWEVSSLTAWGANPETPVTGIKSLTEIISLVEKINKTIKSTSISDEGAKRLLLLLDEIKATLSQPQDTGSMEPSEAINYLKQQLKF